MRDRVAAETVARLALVLKEKYAVDVDIASKKAVTTACRRLFPVHANKSRENVLRLVAKEHGIEVVTKTLTERQQEHAAKKSLSRSFFASKAWKALRYDAIKRDGGRCLACGRRPPEVVLHVDHIKPRAFFPGLALTLDNLQTLCEDCNYGKGHSDATDWREVA